MPSANLRLLEQYHEDYLFYKDTWETIEDFREGASALLKKADKYLPQKPGELNEVYQLRLQRFSVTPLMVQAIQKTVSKLVSSPLYVNNARAAFWGDFREATDGKKRDESELIKKLFSDLLYYGRCYAAVDRRPSDRPIVSKYDEVNLELPHVIVFHPREVINFGDDWYLTKQLINNSRPLEESSYLQRWTLWTKEVIQVYEVPVKLRYGVVDQYYVDGAWRSAFADKLEIPLTEERHHDLGECPLVCSVLPIELWLGNSLYLKQKQHIMVESSWTEAGSVAGSIQRIYTPQAPVKTDDPSVIYEEPDYSTMKFDSSHVLIGANFEYKESTGVAIANLSSQLDKIEEQMKQVTGLDFAGGSDSALQRSGFSKAIDLSLFEDMMKAYGVIMVQLYQDILQAVARYQGTDLDVSVSGLDSFSAEILTDVLEASKTILEIKEQLPPTALKQWWGKLSSLIAGSRSADIDKNISRELEEIHNF